jgi:hypothetical protein
MIDDKELESEQFKRIFSVYYAPRKNQRQSLLPHLNNEQLAKIKQLRPLIEAGLSANPELKRYLPKIKTIWWQIEEVASLQIIAFSQPKMVRREQVKDHLKKVQNHLKSLIALLGPGEFLNDRVVDFLTLTLLSGTNESSQEFKMFKPFFTSFIDHATILNSVIESALKIPPPQKTGRPKKTEQEHITRLVKPILKSRELPFGAQEGSLLLFLTGEILKTCNSSEQDFKPSRRAAQRAVKLGSKPHS